MKNVQERLSDLRRVMKENHCDMFIMPSSDPHSSEYAPLHYTAWEYFSGFSCENATLIVTQDEAALWVDGRFFGAADAALKDSGVQSMHMGVKGVPTVFKWINERLNEGNVLGYVALTMPSAQSHKLNELCVSKKAELKDLPLVDLAWVEDRPALPTTKAWLLDKKYAGLSIKEKLVIVREQLKNRNCTALVITKLDSVAWLFNLRAMDVDNTPYALSYGYVNEDEAIIFSDTSRFDESIVNELKESGVSLKEYDALTDYLKENKKEETVLVDPSILNAALDNVLRNNSTYKVVEMQDPIIMLKAVKNETELNCARESHLRDGASMVRFQMELEERLANNEVLRETDIDDILHKYRSANKNFIVESFGTIAAYGANAAMMHYAPKKGSDAVIEKKGFLLVDSGATYYDGTTDITRTFVVGPLTDYEKLAYTRVLRCHIDVGMAVWKEGATGGEIDMLARQPLWHNMLDYRCGTGHSVSHVGAVHEGPHSLRPHNAVPFVPGMVITDEPGIYEEGKVGIRIENELVCVEAGESEYGKFLHFEPLMYVPIAMEPVLIDDLSKEEKEWINNYHAETLRRLTPYLNEKEVAWLKNKCKAI